MSLKPLICPNCHSKFPIEAALADIAARTALARALRGCPCGDLVVSYITLFAPPKHALSWPRLANLSNEVLDMIDAGRIEHNGRIWAAPTEVWRMALEEMLANRDALRLPLKKHSYLLTVIAAHANKAEGKAERKSEDKRAGRTPIGGQIPHEAEPTEPAPRRSPMPESIKLQLGKFTSRGSDDNS